MSANPLAAVIFLILGYMLFESQLTDPRILTIDFLAFVPIWIGLERLVDLVRFRGKE